MKKTGEKPVLSVVEVKPDQSRSLSGKKVFSK